MGWPSRCSGGQAMALINLHNIEKTYNLGQTAVSAVRGVSLEVDKGEFVALSGPSGSGKSTLLNLIALLDEPTSGTLEIDGQPVHALTDDQRTELRARLIGFVFQRFNLLPVLSALENVALPLELMGVLRSEARQRAREMLGEVGLDDSKAQRPDQLSGGQQQRVAIARGMVTNPSVLIADEPTANLDSDTSMRIIELMRGLNRRRGTTFIFSTHDDRLLQRVDRVLTLTDGRLDTPRHSERIQARSGDAA